MNIRMTAIAAVLGFGALPATAESLDVGWNYFGTSLDNLGNGTTIRSSSAAIGAHVERFGGAMIANFDIQTVPAPSLRTELSVGYARDFFIFQASATTGVNYSFTLTADTDGDAAALVDYMASVTAIRIDPTNGRSLGLGYTLEGGAFAGVSNAVDPGYYLHASVNVNPINSSDSFYDNLGIRRDCDGTVIDASCDGFDALGQPILRPFSTPGLLSFDVGSREFHGLVSLTTYVIGQSQESQRSGLAIIDPVVRLPTGFGGDPTHFALGFAPGVGNSALPSAIPEPATWALMGAGVMVVGGMLRRKASAMV